MLPADASGQRQFRLAGASDSTSNMLGAVTDVGQVRGYQANGDLQVDYGSWLEASLLGVEKSAATRRYLLDWYGIRWVFADAAAGPLAPYQDDRATYEPLKTRTPYSTLATFAYRQASPILSARTTPTALVIGDDAHFELVLRALAAGEVDSRQLVTVQGPATLDDVDPAELRQFDTVLVYGAQLGSADAAASLLTDYVRGGGRLVVEDSEFDGVAHQLVGTQHNPLPITATKRERCCTTGTGRRPMTRHCAASTPRRSAHPPMRTRASGRWRPPSRFATPAPCSTSGKHAVAITSSLGAGQVTWSGIGLPYHNAVFQSVAEGIFLGRLLSADGTPAADPPSDVTFVSSERRELTAGPGREACCSRSTSRPTGTRPSTVRTCRCGRPVQA